MIGRRGTEERRRALSAAVIDRAREGQERLRARHDRVAEEQDDGPRSDQLSLRDLFRQRA